MKLRICIPLGHWAKNGASATGVPLKKPLVDHDFPGMKWQGRMPMFIHFQTNHDKPTYAWNIMKFMIIHGNHLTINPLLVAMNTCFDCPLKKRRDSLLGYHQNSPHFIKSPSSQRIPAALDLQKQCYNWQEQLMVSQNWPLETLLKWNVIHL